MARRRKGDPIDGVLLLDKPTGISSNGALQKVRKMLNASKGGHTGSLDPLATGVLPLCFGEATKFSRYLLDADKSYQTTAQFGIITTSGDSDGETVEQREVPPLSESDLESVLADFRGPIEQVPSMYSALKHQGRPMYEWARKGIQIDRPARPVTIYHLELLTLGDRCAQLDVSCSKGTYIRSLVEDIGLKIGCGAHLNQLRRTKAGHFPIEDCLSLETLEKRFSEGGAAAIKECLLPIDCLLPDMQKICLESELSQSIFNGQTVRIPHHLLLGLTRLYIDQQFVGVAEVQEDGGIAPRRLIQVEGK